MKSFRNLIRCFGIDDELIKLNMYADKVEYQLDNNRRNVIVADRFVNFNTAAATKATVYNYADTSNPNAVGYIPAVSALTGGYGITLTEANTVIYFSNSYDLEIRLQSEDRAHRIGQKDNVTYVDLVSPGTIDEKILTALRDKINIAGDVLGESAKNWLI